MLKKALALWKKEGRKKGSTLHRRLLLFFISVSVVLILLFTLLLSLFGINGTQEKTVQNHLSTELSILSDSIESDFGRISMGGVSLAETLIGKSDRFFSANEITADSLQEHPELLEPLLSEYMQSLIDTANNRYCGGVFVILDATVRSDSDTAKAGIFLKKTQPTATQDVGVDIHYLRGPAQLARDNGIMLIGQWAMEYDLADYESYYGSVVETARENPDLALNRLYYWSGRVMLNKNSESGFLLCVPLRSADGTVFGLCGIEISDRMFKSLYTPEGGDFEQIFTVMAPVCEEGLCSSKGLMAGNHYLSSMKWSEDLTETDRHDGFIHYSGNGSSYSGQTVSVKLYPGGSPFAEQSWSVSVLMPQSILHNAVQGNRHVFTNVVIVLLVVAVVASFLISRRYIKPVDEAFEQIRTKGYTESKPSSRIPEIDDLFAFLAQQDREHDEEISRHREASESLRGEVERLHGEKSALQTQVEQVQTDNTRLAYLRKDEVDPDEYARFVECLHTLSAREREVFNLYVEGKSAKEIIVLLGITDNGLKFHNKNIYSKLGVSSRKELLRYVTILKQDEGGNV